MAQADRRRSSDWNDNDDDNDESAYLSPAEAEQIEEARNVFAKIIDHTCAQGVVDDEWNLFNQNDSGDSALKKCLFSFLPRKESLQANLDTSAPRGFFPEADDDIETYSFKVFDRRNNRLTYENMPSYHKVGMRVLFRGSLQRGLVDSKPIRKFFAKETRRLGEAFDNPESRKHIPSFIKMYQIDTNELLHPELSYYQNFNEFFYRKLKPDARPISQPNNPKSIVSAADCRLIVFDHINQATEIWIKGEHFSLRHLFHDEHLAQEFEGGSIAIFRLAPVDYHRFHSPIDGTIGSDIRPIKGTFFTVNPIAIKDKLDVLTRNQRTVLTIESDIYERVAFVAIGALLVGSVNFTVKSNQRIRKGEELGYFAYGGSTIVVVFRAGMVKWDDDLIQNSKNSMESLVRVGEQIGVRTTDEERRRLLMSNRGYPSKNATITQFFNHFPKNETTKSDMSDEEITTYF